MKRMAFLVPVLYILLAFGLGQTAWAQSEAEYYGPYDQGDRYLLTPEEVDDLVAPIALYPDPLIAQILPAATFFDQIDEAARYVREYGSAARIDDMPWDISVRAVAHYPDVLYMLDQKEDWTVALGQAYIDQRQDVMDAIQRLRAAAQAEGNLYSTPQQQVVGTEEDISIVPADPQYIYVPVYDPQVVYVEPYDPSYTIITFTPFYIGPWLNRDCDWRHHRVYYHGWRGSGWIARSRPHIHDRRGIYTNKNARVIHTNDRILYRDTSGFRQQLRADTTRRLRQGTLPGAAVTGTRPGRPEHRRTPGAARPTGRTGTRSAPATGTVTTPATPGRSPAATGARPTPQSRQRPSPTTPAVPATGTAPATTRRPAGTRTGPAPATSTPATPAPGAAPSPAPRIPGTTPQAATGGQRQPRATTHDVYRGKDVQKSQPASQSGYGGYGTGRDATIYRQRGQSSRENMRSVAPRSSTTPRTTSPASGASKAAPSVPRSTATPPRPVVPSAPTTPRSMAPTTPRSVVSPTPTAPRVMTPAPTAPRPAAPAPRAVAPAPAPVRSAPMSVPSVPSAPPAAPSGMPGGMPRR